MTKMTREEAREALGLTELDEVLKTGLEEYKDAEVLLLEVTKDNEEIIRIKLNLKAIDTLLRLHDYYNE